jgi:hypothetical protein
MIRYFMPYIDIPWGVIKGRQRGSNQIQKLEQHFQTIVAAQRSGSVLPLRAGVEAEARAAEKSPAFGHSTPLLCM